MFATRVRVSPCSARSSPRSLGRMTVIVPSACSTFMRCGTSWTSSPSGPLTIARPDEIDTDTPPGNSIGDLPIRLIRSPDEADDLAADPALLRGAAGHHATRRGQDSRAHPAEDAGHAVLARVDTAAGLGDALQVGDHALTAAAVLELDDEQVEALALLDAVVADVALLLEQARDVLLHPRGGHRRGLLERLVGVPDAREHVGDRIGQHGVPPTTSSWSSPGSRPRGRAPAGRCGRARTS